MFHALPMNDEELIPKCRAGDSEGWDALFDKYYPVAARFVFQLSPDFSHEDTEEICQETFLAVVRNIGAFGGRSSFQTWLLRIATNKARDFREKNNAAKRGGGIVPVSLTRTDDEIPLDPPSPSLTPDNVLLQSETCLLVRESLDELGEPCREIVQLRYYGDLSYDEIADALDLNPKTVSSRLSKCLDRLEIIAREIFPKEDLFSV
jgi:RNA polymerase sigma-70 factor (ECF subfamily)